MKKIFTNAALITAVVLTSVFVSCRIVDAHAENEEKEEEKAVTSLSSALASATTGQVIKIDRNTVISSEININKAVTVSGGGTSLKNKTVNINVSGVTLNGLSNIENVVVSEEVGDGDFTLTNCTANLVTVKGGGSNSGHFNGGHFGQIHAMYEDVRLVFGNTPKVGALHVKHNCKVESDKNKPNSKVHFGTVFVDNGVGKIHLRGRQSIGNLVTKSRGGQKTKIITDSKDIGINKAGDIISEGKTEKIDIESENQEADVPYFEDFTGKEADEIEKNAENVDLAEVEKELNKDVPGCQQLTAEKYGINIKYDVVSNASQINIYRTDSAGKTYLVGIYQTSSGLTLPQSCNYTDYYVEEGETYKYYARYISSQNNNTVKVTETDTVTAEGGSGLREYTSKPVLNLIGGNCFSYEITGTPEIISYTAPEGSTYSHSEMFYFKKKGTTPSDTIVESNIYSVISLTTRSDKMPEHTSMLSIVDSSDIGTELELYKIKNNYSITKGDIKCTWVSIPQDGECGTGFTDNRITLTYDSLPAYVRNSESGAGVDCVVDTSKADMHYSDGQVYKVQLDVNRNYDKESVGIRKSDNSSMTGSKLVFPLRNVDKTVNSIYKFYFRGGDGSNKYSYMNLNMYFKSSSGNGENSCNTPLKAAAYDGDTGYSELGVAKGALLKKSVPETFDITVDETEYAAVMYQEPYLAHSVTDAKYATKLTFNYKWNEKTSEYECNLATSASAYIGTPFYSYRSKVSCNFKVKDEEGNSLYQIDYTPWDSTYKHMNYASEPLLVVNPVPKNEGAVVEEAGISQESSETSKE